MYIICIVDCFSLKRNMLQLRGSTSILCKVSVKLREVRMIVLVPELNSKQRVSMYATPKL